MTMWCMMRRPPIHSLVDDEASTSTLRSWRAPAHYAVDDVASSIHLALPQMPTLRSGRVERPRCTDISMSCPTPSVSSTWNGSCFSSPCSRYTGRNLATSSREYPEVWSEVIIHATSA